MDNLETREFDVRLDTVLERSVTGIAVPYDQDANIGGQYTERFQRGAIDNVDNVKLFYGHTDPIGKVTLGRETDAGYEITAHISQTPKGDEVLTLMRDGVLNKFSVGFVPLESERDGQTVIRTKVALREVSIVPFAAYSNANITEVRNDEPNNLTESEQNPMSETTELDVRAVADEVAELRRIVEAGTPEVITPAAPEFRSAGEALKAIAAGDENAIRAYTGSTTADSVVKNAFVGDLTRIVDQVAVLRNVFSTGVLPAEGNYIEYAQLGSNTVPVAQQSAEGDDLTLGKITVTTATAIVKTFGGYVRLSRQEIERSSVMVLDSTLRAQAIAIGKAMNTEMRSIYGTAVAASVTAGRKVTIGATPTYATWLAAAIDASVKLSAEGLSIDALIVDTANFKSLMSLVGSDGRPVFLTSGAGVNNIGTLNIPTLGGQFANIPVILDPDLSGKTAFVNSAAIRMYSSPVVRLQQENIINLSKDFSVYSYVATAPEIPTGIIAVTAS